MMMGTGRLNFLCQNSAISRGGRKLLKWVGAVVVFLILAAYGMVRYALPHMHRGTLHVGDDAPDASLLALDGSSRFHIRERTGARPLVIVFGSYT